MPDLEKTENKKEKEIEKEEEPKETETNIISDEIDETLDELIFQHRPVRAWRWDAEQSKWRGRGKGQFTIYKNKETKQERIIFVDEKHKKTRLLQYIDGDTKCKYSDNANKEEVEWFGADYTMDPRQPMSGQWKLAFTDHQDVAQQFVTIFNECISAKTKLFTFDSKDEENKIDSFTFSENETFNFGATDIGDGFSSVQTTDGFGNVEWGQSEQNESGFGSFADSETFDFGKLIKDD